MKTFEVHVTFTWKTTYTIEAEEEDEIDQIIYDWLISNTYGIDDVDDWSDYEVESYEKTDEDSTK